MQLRTSKKIDFQMSFDDGKLLDLKLVEMIRKYGLQKYTTLYIPAMCELSDEQIRDFDKDFRIGSHTLTHHLLTQIGPNLCRFEIEEGKRVLEGIVGHPVDSFCYPRGYYNDEIKKMVKDAGFKEARTVKVLEQVKPKDKFEKGTTIHIYPRKEYKGIDWLTLAQNLLNPNNGYFHLWGHSEEIDRLGEWDNFEKFLRRTKEVLDENL